MATHFERRCFPNEFEVRTLGDGQRVIEGHAAVFDKRSQNLGGFVERVAIGAFDETVAQDDVRALFNHDPSLILGRNKSGTLDLTLDSSGLAYRIRPPDTAFARDLMVSMERGDVSQSSFGFSVPPDGDEWGYTEDDTPIRTLRKVKLFDVSPVTFPAYTDADSGVARRSLEAFLNRPDGGGFGNPETLALRLEARKRDFYQGR